MSTRRTEALTVVTSYYNFHNNVRMRNNVVYFLKQMRAARVHVVLVEIGLDQGDDTAPFLFGATTEDDTGKEEGATETSGDHHAAEDDDAAAAQQKGDCNDGEPNEDAPPNGGDADIPLLPLMEPDTLVQQRVTDVLDYKDTAINLGLSHVPDRCEYVCWCDADIVFEHDRWADTVYETCRDKGYTIVQPFHTVYLTDDPLRRLMLQDKHPQFPAPDEEPDTTKDSDAPEEGAGNAGDSTIDESLLDRFPSYLHAPEKGAAGLVWVMPRAVLTALRGLFPYCLTGDGGFVHAALLTGIECSGQQSLLNYHRRGAYEKYYQQYLRRVHKSGVRRRIGTVPLKLYHLYHGARTRKMGEGIKLLHERGFVPFKHLSFTNGLYRWTPAFRSNTDINSALSNHLSRDGACKAQLWRSQRIKLQRLAEMRQLLREFMQMENAMLRERGSIHTRLAQAGTSLTQAVAQRGRRVMRR